MRSRLVVCAALLAAATLTADDAPHAVVPLADVKFVVDEDVKCLAGALESGDPDQGPSTFILKAAPRCVVPWHLHTAAEQLFVATGHVLTEMEGVRPATLGAGGFAAMPGKVKHQFTCSSAVECILFVTFDQRYDITWVRPKS